MAGLKVGGGGESFPGSASGELVYDVHSHANMPQHGAVSTRMTVRLRQVARRRVDGARLMRLAIDPGATTFDKHGSPHPLGERLYLHHRAIFFWQLPTGALGDVMREPVVSSFVKLIID